VEDGEVDWFAHLCERQREEAFPLVLQTTLDGLDAIDAVAASLANCSIVAMPDERDMLATLAGHLRRAQSSVHAPIDTVRDRQIETLQEEVQRISRMLARLAMEPETQREPPSPFIDDHVSAKARSYHAGPKSDYDGPTVSSRDVRQVIRQRRLRDELFDSELFADPAWDMLLDLYAARLDRARVSVSSLCIAAAVPATTALRWIKTLTETGLFERKADQHDARRIFVQLSDGATTAMHRYFARLSDPRLAV
jgi:DNA-binding MarR family transcriptional regulator